MIRIAITIILSLVSIAILPAQIFDIDKGHTFISFSVERFGAVQVVGRFNDFEGSLTFDSASNTFMTGEVKIDVNSLDSGHEVRDGHLKGEMWLHVEKHSDIQFSLRSIEQNSSGSVAIGDLTIRGVTHQVSFPITITGPAMDPTKNVTIGISAQLKVNRQDYGLAFSKLMDHGGLFIGNDVAITIHALAQRRK